MSTEMTLTLKEAIDKLEGFVPYLVPTAEKGENLEVDVIPEQKLQELNKKGARIYIDEKSKYIFLHNNGKYFAYLGLVHRPGEHSEVDSIVVTKEDILIDGLTLEEMARVLNKESVWSDKEYMRKFKSMLRYHLNILEKMELVERRKLIPINKYRTQD